MKSYSSCCLLFLLFIVSCNELFAGYINESSVYGWRLVTQLPPEFSSGKKIITVEYGALLGWLSEKTMPKVWKEKNGYLYELCLQQEKNIPLGALDRKNIINVLHRELYPRSLGALLTIVMCKNSFNNRQYLQEMYDTLTKEREEYFNSLNQCFE